MSSKTAAAADLCAALDGTTLLAPICESKQRVGVAEKSMRRMEATDPDFPPLIRLSPNKTLFDVPATANYLRKKAGNAPRSIRGEAENKQLGVARKLPIRKS